MLNALASRKTATTIPILPVDDKAFTKWRRGRGKATKRWLKASTFRPKGNRVLLVPGEAGPEVALLGRGDESLWTWAGAASRLPPGRYRIDAELSPHAATEAAIGWALSSYRYDRHKSEPSEVDRVLVWPKGANRDEVRRQLGAFALVRDLINDPAEDLGPAELAEAARSIEGARVRVVKGDKLADDFPAVHAVGKGSARAPRLIDLRWGSAKHPRVTLVGKGVCFDSGGLDVKSAAGMLRMRKDMGGAAIVLGLASLIVDAQLPVRLRVIVPAVENLAGPGAYRPGDVVRTRAGKTVEISNTDAEGRVILSDALALAGEEEPELLIDVATLTGSARWAVGSEITPFWTRSRKLADALSNASRASRDPVWRMPLHASYRRHLDSRVADLKNAASTHLAGATIAALFLKDFVDAPERWLHLDVFGWNDHTRPGRPVGGEATGMRALWFSLRDRFGDAESK